MIAMENITYGEEHERQVLDVYLPEAAVQSVFLYFHGGGLARGDKVVAAIFAPYLTERGVAVVSANYRMYPGAQYPDFICDAALAAAWTYHYMTTQLACRKLFVGGSSAGGYLSMMLCFDGKYLEGVGMDNTKIAGYLHDAGQPTAHFTVLKESGIDPRKIVVDESAPMYHVGEMEKYPFMRFIVSDNDMKNRYEQTMLMLGTLAHFGHGNYDHVVMNGEHCGYCGKLDENGESIFGKMIYDFVEKADAES